MRFEKKLIAGGIALALSNGASAGIGAEQILLSGATAPQNFLREDILSRICDYSSTVEVYVDEIENSGGVADVIAGELLNQGDHFVVRCTGKAGLGALSGVDVAIYKYNGGSSTGVAPVANATTTKFLDASPANCGGAPVATGVDVLPLGGSETYDLYECKNAPIVQQTPDAGVSDVEPAVFVGPLARNFGVEPLGVTAKDTDPFLGGDLQVKPGPGLVFGTAVTLPMYDELVDDQQAAGLLPDCPANPTRAERDSLDCMPSLPSGLIRSVFLGQVTSWADVAPYGEPLDTTGVPEGDNVHLCKRTNGSGTHAQFSLEFLGTNCTSTANFPMIEQNNGVAFAGAGFVGVYANSGSSDMDDCLDALGNGEGFNGDFDGLPPTSFPDTGDSTVVTGTDPAFPSTAVPGHPLGRTYDTSTKSFGMGYNSLEKNTALGQDYRFVKVDFVAPTLENAIAGTYSDVYYLSFQNRLSGGAPDPKTGPIRTAAGTPAILDAYFDVWNNIDAAAIGLINDTLEVDPDGVANSGDEWQGGYVTVDAGAALKYDGVSPKTRWARQNLAGEPDSCQNLGLAR